MSIIEEIEWNTIAVDGLPHDNRTLLLGHASLSEPTWPGYKAWAEMPVGMFS